MDQPIDLGELPDKKKQHGARPPPAVHFSIELHAGFSYKEGSVVAHNLPAQVTIESSSTEAFLARGTGVWGVLTSCIAVVV